MELPKIELTPPDAFNFPFPPYSIQKEFMKDLYDTIENGKLGIFESPTGTGKSLSIICGALCWLKDHEKRIIDELEKGLEILKVKSDEETSDWLTFQAENLKNEHLRYELKFKLDKICSKNQKLNEIIQRVRLEGEKSKKTSVPKLGQQNKNSNKENNEDTMVKKVNEDTEDDFLLEEVCEENVSGQEDSDDEEGTPNYGTQIIFCSRTHSQLSQFISEIQKTPYSDDIRVVPLASRQSYCINPSVQQLRNVSLMNEKCLDMQRSSKGRATLSGENKETIKKVKSGSSSCPMLKGIGPMAEKIIAKVSDVEDLVKVAKEQSSCPYYASRTAIQDSQVIVVPYNTLLHKGTREASGIHLDGNIVIVDEAHNLLETISHIHSTLITGQQLAFAYSQLVQYRDKYLKRFTAYNLLSLKQLIFVVGNLIKILGCKPGSSPTEAGSKPVESQLLSITDFISTAEIDNFNIYKLIEFSKNSKLCQKLHGFSEKYSPTVTPAKPVKKEKNEGLKSFLKELSSKKNKVAEPDPTPEEKLEQITGQPLVGVLSFLENLTSSNLDGRVVFNRQTTLGKSSLKYLLLNPAPMFADIVSKARSVILAGGTMQPVSEFKEQLFISSGASLERIHEFACGHVIPQENILPIILSSGPSGRELDFSYQHRSTNELLEELGRVLLNTVNIVPAGMVCFFPSYDYEAVVYNHLMKNGVLDKISLKKKVFREPKKASDVDKVLEDFTNTIQQYNGQSKQNGALLLSVVGGKLSEGLNFSDDLGRCIIVVGMPYPNIKSPELQEKMSFLEKNVGPAAGKIHYDNLCMKAVNQSIGRSVRHKGDFASVLLLDKRYAREAVKAQLPSWIRPSLQVKDKFGPSLSALAKFFKFHASKHQGKIG